MKASSTLAAIVGTLSSLSFKNRSSLASHSHFRWSKMPVADAIETLVVVVPQSRKNT